MEICIISALSKNRVIGKDNKLPWHYPEDLKHFKELTLGYPIVMGRKTYESIGRPLPKRLNIILSRNKEFQAEGCVIVKDMASATELCRQANAEKMFIIGGATIYELAMRFANTMELTHIHKEIEGDTFFPQWKQEAWQQVKRDDHDEFSFVRYERKTE